MFNLFIKKLESSHQRMYEIIKNICINSKSESEWFYKGITYFIPKDIPKKGSDFRPTTCVPNLYKLAIKYVTKAIQAIAENRDLLEDNQLRTIRMEQRTNTPEFFN
jgi:hypothetical protein